MFEPIGGSAPKYAGQNVINPLAAIGAAAIMLDHLGQPAAAARIENAVRKVVAGDIRSLASGKMGLSTTEVGDRVAGYIAADGSAI
jgi:3-isopropylmalate dehydrogenase